MPKRYVENEIRRPEELQPRAQPVDNFQYARGQRLNFTDFAALSKDLTEALTTLELGGAAKQRELGAAEFEKRLAAAMDGHSNLSEAFAKAVSGGLPEISNPYFYTGFAQSAGRNIGVRYGMESVASVTTGYQESTKVNPETGVPPIADSSYQPICVGKT